MRLLPLFATVIALSACNENTTQTTNETAPGASTKETATEAPKTVSPLEAILAAQPAEHQARYNFRHPKETLTFFSIEPGMTVVEVLPGGGWYSQILVPLLGENGTLIGADYDYSMWPHFEWMNEKFLAGRRAWPEEWKGKFSGWTTGTPPAAHASSISNIDESFDNSVDAVLYIRALHNLARFESKGGYLSTALTKSFNLLKPGGVVGVVQHEAAEDKADEWADGSRGYLKKSYVIAQFKAAGFEFAGESAINENEMDQPGDEDFVWRLPPSLATSKDNPEKAAEFKAIGESNRMTLLFKKPE